MLITISEHKERPLSTLVTQTKIIHYLKPHAEGTYVADVRIGLGFTSVRLDSGPIGIAWTAPSRPGSCTHEPLAGTLAGRPARELLEMLTDNRSALSRSLGLAAANALAAGFPRPESTQKDVMEIVDVQAVDHVVMVGFFGPLVPGLRQTGCRLDILEMEPGAPGAMSPEEGQAHLAACSVAIITGTSIITGTLDELLARLGKPRAVVILGPSSPMCPPVFAGTPVTHIAGARVRDASAVEKIISEGGGTGILKPYMDFETICLRGPECQRFSY